MSEESSSCNQSDINASRTTNGSVRGSLQGYDFNGVTIKPFYPTTNDVQSALERIIAKLDEIKESIDRVGRRL